ncbi:MAG: hypothetical protein B6I19_03425 [Bacteroidetes bacterium 4572_114]|nr:MAG: hypothetical protein B6I19_03425 [Bacteroidetes bacterium 4572_114]
MNLPNRNTINYTVKINTSDKKAQSIINLLKELSNDYPFISIYEDETGLSDEMEKELDLRYQYVMNNPEEGKSWEKIKESILSQ